MSVCIEIRAEPAGGGMPAPEANGGVNGGRVSASVSRLHRGQDFPAGVWSVGIALVWLGKPLIHGKGAVLGLGVRQAPVKMRPCNGEHGEIAGALTHPMTGLEALNVWEAFNTRTGAGLVMVSGVAFVSPYGVTP